LVDGSTAVSGYRKTSVRLLPAVERLADAGSHRPPAPGPETGLAAAGDCPKTALLRSRGEVERVHTNMRRR
jgi:hypothetical protein